MKEQAKYSVRGYCGDSDGGYDEESPADTMREAKIRAKDMMGEQHTRLVESTVPITYVEIVKTESGEVVADFFARGGK